MTTPPQPGTPPGQGTVTSRGRPGPAITDGRAAVDRRDAPGPDWALRLSRGTCGLGLVWLVTGAAIVVLHLTAGHPADVDRGAALMILGAATTVLGLVLVRRVRQARRAPTR
jgi:hypothetical protein